MVILDRDFLDNKRKHLKSFQNYSEKFLTNELQVNYSSQNGGELRHAFDSAYCTDSKYIYIYYFILRLMLFELKKPKVHFIDDSMIKDR